MKILFLKFFVENKCFSKTFKLILMHFIHEINWFDCFLHKTSAVFQKILFSRLLIDRMCFLTNKKSLEFLSLVLPGSIAPRLVLNQSNLFFWYIESNFWPIENFKVFKTNLLSGLIITRSVLDRSSFERIEQKGLFLSTCSTLFQRLFYLFLPFLSQPIQSKLPCCFLPQIFKGFCSQA